MISNERQYKITKSQIKKFELAINELKSSPLASDINQKLRYDAHLDSLNSQLEEFSEEVEEYEKLKEGKIKYLKLSLEELPDALIKARIFRGLTQEDLAVCLGVKPQQVQRDEANRYASTSFAKILEIQRVLNIEIREEIIFKEL